MSRSDTWMPLFIGDYLADTMHLSGPEHGAYLLLLMHSWRVGPLPDDDRQLATIARTEPAAWKRMAPTIRAFLTPSNGGLVSPRLERERERVAQSTDQRKAAGKAGASKRWGKGGGGGGGDDGGSNGGANGERYGDRYGDRIAGAMHPPMAIAQQNDGDLESDKEKSSETTSRAVPAEPAPPPDARSVLWSEGLSRLRRLTGKPDKPARALLGQLCRVARDDCALVSALLHEAEAARIGDPIPWLQAAVETRTGGRAPPARASPLSGWHDLLHPQRAPFDIDSTAEEITH